MAKECKTVITQFLFESSFATFLMYIATQNQFLLGKQSKTNKLGPAIRYNCMYFFYKEVENENKLKTIFKMKRSPRAMP